MAYADRAAMDREEGASAVVQDPAGTHSGRDPRQRNRKEGTDETCGEPQESPEADAMDEGAELNDMRLDRLGPGLGAVLTHEIEQDFHVPAQPESPDRLPGTGPDGEREHHRVLAVDPEPGLGPIPGFRWLQILQEAAKGV